MRFSTRFAVALGLFFACAGLIAQTPAMLSSYARFATPNAVQPAVAIDPSGKSVVVWRETVGSDSSLFGRRFDVFQEAMGDAFRIESLPPHSGSELFQSLAMDGSGNFVVAWEQPDQDDLGIYGRLFSAAGVPQGLRFQINSFSTSSQSSPSIARNLTGDFVVVWQSARDGDGFGIYAQRYDDAGAPQGSEFRVNTYTTDSQTSPSVAMNAAGDFVVVWQSSGQDGSGQGVFGQRYDASGTPQGPEFRVNNFTQDDEQAARVAMFSSGGFVVVWAGSGHGASSSEIIGRRYDRSGVAQGGEFPVFGFLNTTSKLRPDVAASGSGDFLVVSSLAGGQRFDAAGRRLGSWFGFQAGYRNNPVVSMNERGNFVVASRGLDFSGGRSQTNSIRLSRGEFRAAGVMRVDESPEPGSAVRPEAIAANGVIEPGETVTVAPTWTNTLQGTLSIVGGSQNYGEDFAADYGPISEGATVNCEEATGNCYRLTISGRREGTHWDWYFPEWLTGFPTKSNLSLDKDWMLHVGESFTDVPTNHPYYRAIETVLHAGIATGCNAATYCPDDPVTRSQMSLFLARAIAGGGQFIPTSGFVGDNAYDCTVGGTSLFTDILPTDISCRSVHYLASRRVTLGCSPTQYCPTPNVTRLEMSAFVARSVVAPGLGAAVPLTYGPDPVTNLSYSCDPANPKAHFDDVPASSSFCKHAHFLWAKGVITDCGTTSYCPNDPVTRDAMAQFLTNGFGLNLYGP